MSQILQRTYLNKIYWLSEMQILLDTPHFYLLSLAPYIQHLEYLTVSVSECICHLPLTSSGCANLLSNSIVLCIPPRVTQGKYAN